MCIERLPLDLNYSTADFVADRCAGEWYPESEHLDRSLQVFFSFVIVLLVIWACNVAYWTFSWMHRSDMQPRAFAMSWLSSAWKVLGWRFEMTAEERYVWQRVGERRVRQSHLCFSFYYVMQPFGLIYAVVQLLQDGVWDLTDRPELASETLVNLLWIEYVTFSAVTTWAVNFPRHLSPKSLDFINTLFMSMMAGHTLIFTNVNRLSYNHGFIAVIRCLVSAVSGNAQLMVALNIFCWLSELLIIRGLYSCQPWSFATFSCAVSCVAAVAVEQRMIGEEQAKLKAASSQQIQETVLNLLSSICDAVVRLGTDMEIVEGAQNLDALLLRGTSSANLPFPNLVDEADRERCIAFILQPTPTRPITLKLSSSIDQRVVVELFCSSILDVVTENHHWILGIKERTSSETFQFPDAVTTTIPAAQRAEAVDANVQLLDGMPRESSNSSGGSSGSNGSYRAWKPGEVVLRIDAGDESMPILRRNPSVDHILGLNPQNPYLAPQVSNGQELQQFVHEQINILAHSSRQQTQERFTVLLQSHYSHRNRPRPFECSVKWAEGDPDSNDGDIVSVDMTFHRPVKQRSNKRPAANGRIARSMVPKSGTGKHEL